MNEAELIQTHESRIRALARSYLRPRVEMDDLLQEARVALLLASRTWRGDAAFWTYARHFIERAMLDAIKQATREDLAEGDLDEIESSENTDLTERQTLGGLLDNLNSQERAVIVMHLDGDKSFQEVGAALGTSKDTVRRIYNAAITTLRERAA